MFFYIFIHLLYAGFKNSLNLIWIGMRHTTTIIMALWLRGISCTFPRAVGDQALEAGLAVNQTELDRRVALEELLDPEDQDLIPAHQERLEHQAHRDPQELQEHQVSNHFY